MAFIIAGLLLLWLGSTMLREFLRASPAAMARRMKQGGGFVALALALLLLMRGQIDVAIGLAGVGFWLTSGKRTPDWGSLFRSGRPRRASRRVSRVRSRLIEMELDHESGVMRGGVLDGALAGRGLEELGQFQLSALHGLCVTEDPEGARLLEAYFDRRFPGWREADQGQGDTRRANGAGGAAGRAAGMSENEAYKLLGLSQGASRDEIARAHRTLMKKFHPDHGGSTDVAARVNEAKDVLMRRHP